MDLPDNVIECLRRLDLQSLYELAGKSVVSAVRSAFETNQEIALAKVVFYKFGYGLLGEAKIRSAIIEALPPNELDNLCASSGISGASLVAKYGNAIAHFQSYTPEKSTSLVDALGFPPTFYLHPTYDEREPVEYIEVVFGQQVSLKGYLHAYQKRIKDAINRNLSESASRFIVQMPTGAGKTYTALEAVVDALRAPGQNGYIVWLVDSNELSEQALSTFRELWRLKGDATLPVFRLFSRFEADYSQYNRGVVFAGFDKLHSIISNPDHPRYNSVWHLIPKTQLVVIDEAHSAVAATRQEAIDSFAQNSAANIVGLTATPARTQSEETEELSRLFHGRLVGLVDDGEKEIADPIRFLQDGGYLAEVQGDVLETHRDVVDSNESNILASLASDADRNAKILEQVVLANEQGEATLVFACTKDHVFALRVLCEANDIPVEHITGEVPQSERIKILDRFRRREFFILLNLDILATGIDVPNVNKLILTRPLGSPIQYSQILGRAYRGPKNGGNARNVVINVRDNLTNFPQANMLYEAFADQFADRP